MEKTNIIRVNNFKYIVPTKSSAFADNAHNN